MMGVVYLNTFNGLSEYVNLNTLGIHVSQSFDIGRSEFNFTANLNFGEIIKDYGEENEWINGQSAVLSLYELSYGYQIYKNDRFLIVPFAGISFNNLRNVLSEEQEEDDRYKSVNYRTLKPIFGVNFDYIISRTISVEYNEVMSRRTSNNVRVKEVFIRLRTIYGNYNFNTSMNGKYVGAFLILGYNF